MTKSKYSPVFPIEVAPVNEGVYQRKFKAGGWKWARWYKGLWCVAYKDFYQAKNEWDISAYQTTHINEVAFWRGLKDKPV